MLLKTVTFDRKNQYWANNRDYNFRFLHAMERHLNDLIRYRGYVYLNQICELLGVKWDLENENVCVKNDGIDRIVFIQFDVFDRPNNSFLVNILSYDQETET